VTTRPQEYHGR